MKQISYSFIYFIFLNLCTYANACLVIVVIFLCFFFIMDQPRRQFAQMLIHRGNLESCSSLLTRYLYNWRFEGDGNPFTGNWFHNLDSLGMQERQNWKNRGFWNYVCTWQELLVNFPGFARSGIKDESSCECKWGWSSFIERARSTMNFIAFF